MGCVMVYVAGMYPLGAGYARIRDSVAMLVSSYVVTVLFTLDILFWCRQVRDVLYHRWQY